MKKTLVALLILLGVALSLPQGASALAVALSNTGISDAQFQTIAGNPILRVQRARTFSSGPRPRGSSTRLRIPVSASQRVSTSIRTG